MIKRKGITLIELVLVLGLLSLVISTITPIFIFGNQSFRTLNKSADIVSTARYSMDYITRQIRKSEVVEVENNKLILDSGEIYLDDDKLFNDGKQISDSIDGFSVTKGDNKLDITIIIDQGGHQEYTISSVVYTR